MNKTIDSPKYPGIERLEKGMYHHLELLLIQLQAINEELYNITEGTPKIYDIIVEYMPLIKEKNSEIAKLCAISNLLLAIDQHKSHWKNWLEHPFTQKHAEPEAIKLIEDQNNIVEQFLKTILK